MGESYPDLGSSFTRDPILPSVRGKDLSSLSSFSCMFLLQQPNKAWCPVIPPPVSFSNVSVGLVCVSFPFCSRLPPGICAILPLRNCQLFSLHGNSGTFLQFGAQLSPGEPLFPFALSFLLNEKMGSFLPATASAMKCCPSFQCRSHHSNGSVWTEWEGRQSGTKCTVFGGGFAIALLLTAFHSLLPALSTRLCTGGPAGGIWLSYNPFPAMRGGPSCSITWTGLGCLIWHPQFSQGREERYFL